jgi:Ca-activated chloride channel homolog
VLVGAYLLAQSRATRYAVRFPAVSTLALAATAESRWRRLLPMVLALAALTALGLALARPHRVVRIPVGRASIVLVTDHSGSMQATDVQPTRLAAAESAARTFVNELPTAVDVGVVTFSDTPDTGRAPTADHRAVLSVIDAQRALGATDTGDALEVAVGLLRQNAKRVPSAIVLLSDGTTTTGRDPVDVASEAAELKIPIYTVALGSQNTTIPNPEGFGAPVAVPPDPELLGRIAQASEGQTFTAQDPHRLTAIYRQLGSRLSTRPSSHDITAAFALAALVLLIAAAATSLRFGGRLP